jgi:ribose 5-phosphate isomerase B
MKVIVGADDTGAVLDAVVVELATRDASVEVLPSDSWPQVARRVAEAVAEGRADLGILACWTGTGTSIMANKVKGVRAALCWEPWIAEGARRWNDANVLVLSSQRTSPEMAREILSAWLGVAAPDPDEVANIAEIARYEQRP